MTSEWLIYNVCLSIVILMKPEKHEGRRFISFIITVTCLPSLSKGVTLHYLWHFNNKRQTKVRKFANVNFNLFVWVSALQGPLLDLSATLDTVDHQLLLNRLHKEFGVSGKVLDWFASYLSNRSQNVTVDDALSDRFSIDYGVSKAVV